MEMLKFISNYQVLIPLLVTLLLIIIFIFILNRKGYVLLFGGKEYGFQSKKQTNSFSISNRSKITGRRLFEYEGYYPIDISPGTNIPSLNSEVFIKAINFLLDKNDMMAAMDLVYLREDNKNYIKDPLKPEYQNIYEKLIEKYNLEDYRKNYYADTEIIFNNYIRITNDLGAMLEGVYFESILHNVRNPLRSIIALSNSSEVSKRKLYDPSTRFVVQYVKHQGKDLEEAFKSGSKVAYEKQFTKDRKLKATTTPIYHEELGLIGILCFNIDTEKVKTLDENGIKKFLKKYIKTTGTTPKFEIDEAPTK